MTKHIATKAEKLPKSEVEISGSIPAESIASYRAKALKEIGKDLELPGFRKGMVPEQTLVSKLGEAAIIEEAAELALQDSYASMLAEHKLSTIGRPKVTLTKVTPGEAVEFKIKAAVLPEVKIADYKKIAAAEMKKPSTAAEVTEKDIDEVIEQVRKSRAEHDHHKDHAHLSEEEHASLHSKEAKDGKAPELALPEVSDAFAQSLGDFKNVADLRAKIKENMKADKEHKEKDKKRLAVLEELVKKTEIDLPEILIEAELAKLMGQFEDDVIRMGVKMEDYLKHAKKTREDILKEWRPDADKRARTQLIFNKIAALENLIPTEKEIEEEAKHVIEQYPTADKESVKVFVETMLSNEKVFKLFEEQK